jgi:hypothetical protein
MDRNPVPALIPEPTFARAQERLAQNQRLSIKNTREITLLQGLLVCAECGYALYRTSTRTSKRRAKYYRCLGSDRWRQLMKTPCTCRPIRVEDVDEAVWTQVKRLLEDPFLIRTELERRRDEGLRANPIEQRRHRVQHDIQRVNQQIDKLLDAYQEGLLGLGELRQRMPALRKKQAAAQKELESAHWQALADEQLRQLDQSLETFLGRLKQSAQNLSVADKQKIIRLLVKEIIVEKDAIIVRHCIPVTGNAEPKEQLNGQTDQSTYQVCTRSHRRPLRGAAGRILGLRRSALPSFAVILFHGNLQPEHRSVAHTPGYTLHQLMMRDRVTRPFHGAREPGATNPVPTFLIDTRRASSHWVADSPIQCSDQAEPPLRLRLLMGFRRGWPHASQTAIRMNLTLKGTTKLPGPNRNFGFRGH